jgi:long-chain acyl-CoA synthetase
MLIKDILSRSVKFYPDKTAVTFKESRLTYQEFSIRVKKLVSALLNLGVKKGDRIPVLQDNCHQYIELYFAIPEIGAVIVPLNYRLGKRELLHILNDITPKVMFVGKDFLDVIDLIKPELKTSISNYICVEGPHRGMESYEDLLTNSSETEAGCEIDEGDVALQIYTSGTTGRPKGAMLTHRNVVSNTITATLERRRFENDIYLGVVPVFHVAVENVLQMLYVGGRVILLKQFDSKTVLEMIEKEKVTFITLVPAMINFLLDDPDIGKYDLSSLSLLFYGASPMPVDRLKKAIEVFKCDFMQTFGQTEASPMISILQPKDHIVDGSEGEMEKLASCGREAFNVEVKIVDEDDKEVATGEVGEIAVRGHNVMKGYWNMPEETAKTLRNGWLHTGDMGRMDDEGYIYIVDRKKDMIISGGENIYPKEIEEVLYTHPSILEAAVIGVPDEKWGEAVKAVVVLKEGKKATEEEIIEFCKENLASYKKPKSVDFVETLPRTPSGKVLKPELRKRYWKEYEKRV